MWLAVLQSPHSWGVQRWSVAQIHELSKAIVAAGGDCFLVRRTLQQLEAEELTISEATAILRNIIERRVANHSEV